MKPSTLACVLLVASLVVLGSSVAQAARVSADDVHAGRSLQGRLRSQQLVHQRNLNAGWPPEPAATMWLFHCRREAAAAAAAAACANICPPALPHTSCCPPHHPALGAGTCPTNANTNIVGTSIVSYTAANAGACCNLCNVEFGCGLW